LERTTGFEPATSTLARHRQPSDPHCGLRFRAPRSGQSGLIRPVDGMRMGWATAGRSAPTARRRTVRPIAARRAAPGDPRVRCSRGSPERRPLGDEIDRPPDDVGESRPRGRTERPPTAPRATRRSGGRCRCRSHLEPPSRTPPRGRSRAAHAPQSQAPKKSATSRAPTGPGDTDSADVAVGVEVRILDPRCAPPPPSP
jgi:hypothetical protein